MHGTIEYMKNYLKRCVAGLLSIMLLSGIFVDPVIASVSDGMDMSGHEMMVDCVACVSPVAAALCVQHCIDRTSDHLDVYRDVNVAAPTDVMDGFFVYEDVGFDFSYYDVSIELLEPDLRLESQLNIQKRE